MTDADPSEASRPARRRPTYGLPGPTPPASAGDPSAAQDASASGASGSASSAHDAPSWPGERSPYGAPGPQSSHADDAGRSPAAARHDGSGPLPTEQAPRRRRRGLWPLISGLVLMLVLAPALTIGGIIWGICSVVGDFANGPTVMDGGTAQVEVPKHQMVVVYVPTADAQQATCTATGADGSTTNLTVTETSGTSTFPNGETYTQTIGAMAMEDMSVTLSCEGTDAPAYMGPFAMWGMLIPILLGPLLGAVLGLVGLILVIIGIVKMLRSRRA